MKRTIKIGIIQQTCTNDIRHNLSKLHRNIEQVAAAGAQLVVLQELHNTSYFCQTEGNVIMLRKHSNKSVFESFFIFRQRIQNLSANTV